MTAKYGHENWKITITSMMHHSQICFQVTLSIDMLYPTSLFTWELESIITQKPFFLYTQYKSPPLKKTLNCYVTFKFALSLSMSFQRDSMVREKGLAKAIQVLCSHLNHSLLRGPHFTIWPPEYYIILGTQGSHSPICF